MNKERDNSNDGYTIFKSTGVRQEYPEVDLLTQRVTCTVLYKDEIYMTVIVDLKNDTVQVRGDVDELGDLTISKEAYIDLFRSQAEYFIANRIADPQKYFDEIIGN